MNLRDLLFWTRAKATKEATAPLAQLRDALFGDVPLSDWAGGKDGHPWRTFALAQEALASGRKETAITELKTVVSDPILESRHYLQAWHALRALGVEPEPTVGATTLGVVVEVGMAEGLDVVAAYADGTARYFNYSGAAIVWERPDGRFDGHVQTLLQAGQAVVRQIGPWQGQRRTAPIAGTVRLSMLTPKGLYFGEGPSDALATDPMAAPVMVAASSLMRALTRV